MRWRISGVMEVAKVQSAARIFLRMFTHARRNNGGSGDECPCKFIPRIPLSFFLSFFPLPNRLISKALGLVGNETKPNPVRPPIKTNSRSLGIAPTLQSAIQPHLLVPSIFREGRNLLSWTQNANTLDGWKPLPNGRRTWPGG